MDASIKGTIQASDKEIQYDEKAKKLLGHKIILAHILVNTIDEFRGMNPKEVVKYIEGLLILRHKKKIQVNIRY